MTCVCQLCNAYKWAREPAGMCCSSGKVRLLPLHEPSTPLRRLIAGSHPDSKHFLKTIRQYNNFFQMTSFGAQVVREEGWMLSFKIQGQVYHRIGSLLPEETSTPKFLQLYFIADYNLQAEIQIGILPLSGRVSRRDVILLLLQAMLHGVNSYIRSFKYALENAPFPSFSIVIDADKRPHDEHERRYNAPACNKVAAIIHGEQDSDTVHKSRDGALHRISETHRSYDTLQYPLHFPYSDDGYHFGIPLHTPGGQPTTSSKALSCKAFYSYRFMVRDGDLNLLHRCRELFH
ncbi:unnamed protein product [Acanthosepion pharaonis]|uniref:Helitron helicase-like domain-containing protein n=1 Tax=Acanthosepion pharaonis TaxID=158019 RepID=A0A812ATK6_ACAPH|nr:unnamed protein product [Sepia pharaonis]